MDQPELKDTTAKLRNRSWEMELLISGFVLVLLLPVPNLVEQWGTVELSNLNTGFVQQIFTVVFVICLYGSRILIANLIIYLLLRGFWIGVVGLMSAFPKGVNWAHVSYSEIYQNFLKQKTADNESYIATIAKVSSSVFSFSFLLVFLVASFFLALLPPILMITIVNDLFAEYPDTHWVSTVLGITIPVLLLAYFGLATLFLIDFLTFGIIKQIRWKPFVRFYYPIYRFFRWVTLARLYTPIYYTLVSNVRKRTLALVLFCYILVLFLFNNFSYTEEVFYPKEVVATEMLTRYYEDQHDTPRSTLFPLIPSEFVEHNYLRLFLPYLASDNDSLQQTCPESAILNESGFVANSEIALDFNSASDTIRNQPSPDSSTQESNVQAALRCLADLYQISIDGSLYQPDTFYFYRRKANSQPGLITYVALTSLSVGPHRLTIEKRDYSSSILDAQEVYYIPFVKE